jgi:hypothetical protein
LRQAAIILFAEAAIKDAEERSGRAQGKHPSTNLQAPEKLQAPNITARGVRLGLEVEVWSFSGCWSLVLGAF